MRARGPRTRLIAGASILLGSLALAATGASGITPSEPSPIPEIAFQPVTVPSIPTAPDALVAPQPSSTPDLGPYLDVFPSTAPDARPQPDVPDADPIVVLRPTPTPKPVVGSQSGGGGAGHSISGAASWYCRAGYSICTNGHPDGSGFDAYAAAGPKLRAALGDWRGRVVTVDGIKVKLIDWCQCYKGQSNEKLLDLYYDVFARVGSKVTIRW